MFPYDVSLDTILHRREKPLRKSIAPFLVVPNRLIWKNLAEKALAD